MENEGKFSQGQSNEKKNTIFKETSTSPELQHQILIELCKKGGEIKNPKKTILRDGKNIYEILFDYFEEQKEKVSNYNTNSGKQPNWNNVIQNAVNNLRDKKFMALTGTKQIWQITDAGKEHLKENGILIDYDKTQEKQSINDTNIKTPEELEEDLKRQKEIGEQGEKFVLEEEKQYLIHKGKKDLAAKVERISIKNVFAGYDILSFDEQGNEKYIEVKTTASGYEKSFFITTNEIKTCEKLKEKYFIYRVFNINTKDVKIEKIENFHQKKDNEYLLTPKQFEVFKSEDKKG